MAQVETKRMPCARALYGFEGQSKHELNFSAGVSIMLLRRIDENWLEGQLEGKVGIFPANYVKIELGSPSLSHESALARSGRPYAIALHPFQGGQTGDLSLSKGELVELIASVGSDWLKGRIQNRTGIFPASFVQVVKSPEEGTRLSNGVVPELATFSIGMNHHDDITNVSNGDNHDGVDCEESSDSLDELRPTPKPRSIPRHSSAPSAVKMGAVIVNGSGHVTRKEVEGEGGEGGEGVEEVTLLSSGNENHPTPSRSAPAPPNSTELSSHQPQRFGTLPLPKPRKKMTRHQSVSDHNQSISSLESQRTIEQKMLESAQNMLQTGPSEAKREKLQEAVQNHQMNMERLTDEIEKAKAERDAVEHATTVAPTTTAPARPRPPKSTHHQQEKLRSKTIDELVFTERDFHHQMELCNKKVVPALKEVPYINGDILFGNLSDVTRLSGDFLTALEESCRDQQAVGGVFVTFAPKLRDVYAVYCRNHDTASSTLEKYMESPATAERIRQAMDELRGEIQAWDLQSLLIKPVQRVLKYPLLLDKLAECTPAKHPDHKSVLEAREVIEKVAQDINEIKRRKDLVERYTGPTKDERRGTVSMHSLQKKVRRIQQAFTQLTGLRSKTIDPKFDELEQKVLSLETLLRTLVKDINTWQEEIQHMLECRELFGDGMALYCSESESSSLENYIKLLSDLKTSIKAHARFVKDYVTTPLETLLSLFEDPLHLIQKRKDKLLDYDHMQYALEHAEAEPEKIKQLSDGCLLARRNYEALNTQLLEELPHFLEAAVKMLQHQLTVLVQAQYAFHNSVSKHFTPFCNPIEDSSELQMKHINEIAQVTQNLVKVSLVPASLAMNFTSRMSIPRRVSEGSVSPQISPRTSPRMLKSLVSPQRPGVMEEDETEIEEEGPPIGTKLKVLYDFEAQDRAELSVMADQVVTLLCPHDRIGCTEWWLVEGESGKGYVPATYLEEENYPQAPEDSESSPTTVT